MDKFSVKKYFTEEAFHGRAGARKSSRTSEEIYAKTKSQASEETNVNEVKLTTEIRGHWDMKLDFIFSCVGFAVGLGNIWRFPFKVLSNGGGTFIIAYLIMLYTMALPLFLIELTISQFSNRGATECWNFAIGLKGIGLTMLIVSLMCGLYYNLIICWSIYYLINSLKRRLPWATCNNWWNDKKCVRSDFTGVLHINKSMEMSSEQFWLRNVITRIETIDKNNYRVLTMSDNPETIVWYTALCLMVAWLICALVLMFGIKVSGKAMWFYVTFPYFVLTIMMIIASRLEGSLNGLKYLIQIDFRRLLGMQIWYAAAEQIFYSLGLGFGGMMTFGSYNNFHDNIPRDALIISVVNSGTSIFAIFATFGLLGNISYRYGENFTEMSKYAGDGLIFIAYPEVLSSFKGANLLCFLFFTMVFSLGIDSQIGMLEVVITGILDEFPQLHRRKRGRLYFVWILHLTCYIVTLIMVTKTGFFWFTIFSYYAVSTNLLFIGFCECISVVYIYGMKNIDRDFKMMIGYNLNYYFKFCMYVIIPIVTMVLTVLSIYFTSAAIIGHSYHIVQLPPVANAFGWFLFVMSIVPIPAYFIFYVIQHKRKYNLLLSETIVSAITPNMNWGPGSKENWLLDDVYKDKLTSFQNHKDFIFYEKTNLIVDQSNMQV